MFVFGLFALAFPISLAGLMADPPARGAWLGAIVGLVDLAIVVLLLRRSTADDFELAERDRNERRRERTTASRSSA